MFFKVIHVVKLSEYEVSRDRNVTMKYITRTNRVFRASGYRDDQRVIYALQLLRGQDLIWWERVYQTLGDDVEENMYWDEFVGQIKTKYCVPCDIEMRSLI